MRTKLSFRSPHKISFGILCLLAALPATAEAEQILVSAVQSDAPPSAQLTVDVRPGADVDFDATFGADENSPEPAGPTGQFHWNADCGDSSHPLPCGSGTFDAGTSDTFEIPEAIGESILLTISHDDLENGTKVAPGQLLLRNSSVQGGEAAVKGAQGNRYSLSDSEFPGFSASQGGRHKYGEGEESEEPGKPHHGGGMGGGMGGGGGGSFGSGGSSESGSPSAGAVSGKSAEAGGSRSYYDGYDDYFSYGSGPSSGSSTTRRGYNRDQEVPVTFCTHESRADGKGMELRCETAASKVLRKQLPMVAQRKRKEIPRKPLLRLRQAKSEKKPGRKKQPAANRAASNLQR
jgi:hypothetical protein